MTGREVRKYLDRIRIYVVLFMRAYKYRKMYRKAKMAWERVSDTFCRDCFSSRERGPPAVSLLWFRTILNFPPELHL